MAVVEFWQPAGDGCRFTVATLARLAGQTLPLRIRPAGTKLGTVRVVSVVVDHDARGATWVVELAEDCPVVEAIRREVPGFVLAYQPPAELSVVKTRFKAAV